MSLPIHASFIDGKVEQGGPRTFDLVTPHDGKVIAQIAESGPDGVERAVKAASAAFAAHRKQPVHVRVGSLKAAAAGAHPRSRRDRGRHLCRHRKARTDGSLRGAARG